MYGHSAVERNRLKRRLREIVRTQVIALLPAGADVVIRSSSSRVYEVPFAALGMETLIAVRKLVHLQRDVK